MLPDDDQQLQISRFPPDDDQQMLPGDQQPEKSRSSDLELLEKSFLTDEHRRGILFALEYAMLAILDRSPFPVPPLVTDAYLDKLVTDMKANIPRPVPVPRDWEPSLKTAAKDVKTLRIVHNYILTCFGCSASSIKIFLVIIMAAPTSPRPTPTSPGLKSTSFRPRTRHISLGANAIRLSWQG